MNKNKSIWKGIAITSIIINILIILSVVLMVNIGLEATDKENECSFNVCNGENIASYFYDDIEELCYCFDYDDEIVIQQYMID